MTPRTTGLAVGQAAEHDPMVDDLRFVLEQDAQRVAEMVVLVARRVARAELASLGGRLLEQYGGDDESALGSLGGVMLEEYGA